MFQKYFQQAKPDHIFVISLKHTDPLPIKLYNVFVVVSIVQLRYIEP